MPTTAKIAVGCLGMGEQPLHWFIYFVKTKEAINFQTHPCSIKADMSIVCMPYNPQTVLEMKILVLCFKTS